MVVMEVCTGGGGRWRQGLWRLSRAQREAQSAAAAMMAAAMRWGHWWWLAHTKGVPMIGTRMRPTPWMVSGGTGVESMRPLASPRVT